MVVLARPVLEGVPVWEVLGEVTVPAGTQVKTVEKKVLEQGEGVPTIPVEPGEAAYVQLVRADAVSDAVPVMGRAAVLVDVVSEEDVARALEVLAKANAQFREALQGAAPRDLMADLEKSLTPVPDSDLEGGEGE